ncbi:DNA mismatch repair endonuclease MutL [Candidatus Woesebacteria bacterium]|nr:DNA mismatch repair endonuclease MutL [Candidatus Woesebacteria bacterium]
MPTIIHLPETVVSKIAAGEVIERPGYIVKELIENAIDAGALSITITLERYGIGKIVVADNGTGMDHEDILVCFLRHTTSKIRTDEDLAVVQSLGFRGEALASIAAIGHLTLRSRSMDVSFGKEVIIEGGRIKKVSSKGMPVGTQIIAEDVFSQVPVRKKFLQSPQAEYRLILEIVQRFALAYPGISFEVTHDEKRVFTLPASPSLLNRAEALLTSDVVQQLFPVQGSDEYISVEGFVSPPQLNYKSSRNIQWYINKRYVYESKFNATVKSVYGTLLEPLAFPFVLLFITIPSHLIDVNIHPRKEQIHMLESERICKLIEESIITTLSKQNLRFYDRRWGNGTDINELHDGGTQTYAASILKKKVNGEENIRKPIQVTDIVQMHNIYLVIPSENGVLLVDQHAAHERVLFEKFQTEFVNEKNDTNSITLDKQIKLHITEAEKELISEKAEIFKQLGFHIEEKKRQLYVLAVPELFKDRDVQQFIRDLLDDLFEQNMPNTYDTVSNNMLKYLACRSAIKAGDPLTKSRAKELIDELNATKNPYTCPHGRPTQVEIELPYLHRLFKRT